MKVVNLNLYPSGGHFFKDSDGSNHRAGSWKRVIEKVRDYRARAGLPPGNPNDEVMAQACVRQPAICNNAPTQVTVVKKDAPFKAKVLQWFREISKSQARGPLRYVSELERKQRVAICSKCPFNIDTETSGCGSCKAAVAAYRRNLLASRPVDDSLGGCKILNADLPTAVSLDEVRVDNAALPAHCWRKISV
jgi:hypothetical protein